MLRVISAMVIVSTLLLIYPILLHRIIDLSAISKAIIVFPHARGIFNQLAFLITLHYS